MHEISFENCTLVAFRTVKKPPPETETTLKTFRSTAPLPEFGLAAVFSPPLSSAVSRDCPWMNQSSIHGPHLEH